MQTAVITTEPLDAFVTEVLEYISKKGVNDPLLYLFTPIFGVNKLKNLQKKKLKTDRSFLV
jgi:hypothetical protein